MLKTLVVKPSFPFKLFSVMILETLVVKKVLLVVFSSCARNIGSETLVMVANFVFLC